MPRGGVQKLSGKIMTTIKQIQCCYCKSSNDRINQEYFNLEKVKEIILIDKKIQIYIAHGCELCKAYKNGKKLTKKL